MITSTQLFRISLEYQPRKPCADIERYGEWSSVFLSLLIFLDAHEGTFSLNFDDSEVIFEVDLDLP